MSSPSPTSSSAKGVAILGSTGTIGVNTLDVIRRHRRQFRVIALTAHSDIDTLFKQVAEFEPIYVVVSEERKAKELQQRAKELQLAAEILSGEQGMEMVVGLPETDLVMAAIVGAAGLLPTMAAAKAGKRILLANKEALVMSGKLFLQAIHQGAAELLPIDSEHNALFQCLPILHQTNFREAGVSKLILTASGGPFLHKSKEEFKNVTPEQACNHPNWRMGKKISVDSATMMNKGLEIIEACHLFECDPSMVDVVIHPQSIVHSMVAYADGSVLAHLGYPDMRIPIAHALAWPARIDSGVSAFNPLDLPRLEFMAPDLDKFTCIALAYEALQQMDTATTILNAANEVAVRSFLQNEIRFDQIPVIIRDTLESVSSCSMDSLDTVLEKDREARQYAYQYIKHHLN